MPRTLTFDQRSGWTPDQTTEAPSPRPSGRIKTKNVDGMKISIQQTVSFSDNVETHKVIPYSAVYGVHPSRLVFTGPVGSYTIRLVSHRANSFTGSVNDAPPSKPRTRRENKERTARLRDILCNGSTWAIYSASSVDMFVAAVKPKYLKKRLGAKAVKAQESLDNPGEQLTELQATTFRALAAGANDLALDRPDIAFSAKELCRAF